MAPVIPLVGRWSRFPIHTPAVYRSEKPTAQQSRWSVEVPVLTAVCTGKRKRWPSPNSSRLACGSDNMSPITAAAAGPITALIFREAGGARKEAQRQEVAVARKGRISLHKFEEAHFAVSQGEAVSIEVSRFVETRYAERAAATGETVRYR